MNRSVIEHAKREPQYLSANHAVSDLSLPSSNDTPNTEKQNRPAQMLSKILRGLGPTLILVGFAAVFYYGHQKDWKLPKFGALTGNAKVVVQDWCEEHSVPESICVQCDPSLMPKGPDYGWCDEHGVHNCPLHHPDIAQLKSTAFVDQADFERAARTLAVAPPIENNRECKFYQNRIQFASVESVRQAGVDVELVDRGKIVESIHGSGSIVYDPTRKASLASRAAGSVWDVKKNVGDKIAKGDLLAIIDAAEVGNIKTALMRALAEEKLRERNVARLTEAQAAIAGSLLFNAQAALSKARADVLNAEQSLRNLGLKIHLDELADLSEQQIIDRLDQHYRRQANSNDPGACRFGQSKRKSQERNIWHRRNRLAIGTGRDRYSKRSFALGRLLPSRICPRQELFRWSRELQSFPCSVGSPWCKVRQVHRSYF